MIHYEINGWICFPPSVGMGVVCGGGEGRGEVWGFGGCGGGEVSGWCSIWLGSNSFIIIIFSMPLNEIISF